MQHTAQPAHVPVVRWDAVGSPKGDSLPVHPWTTVCRSVVKKVTAASSSFYIRQAPMMIIGALVVVVDAADADAAAAVS